MANRNAKRLAISAARIRFSGPSASTVHCGDSMSSTETNVGSPPIVSRTSLATSALSTVCPSASMASH